MKIIITSIPYFRSSLNVGQIYRIKRETPKGFVLISSAYRWVSKKHARIYIDPKQFNRNGANNA